MGIYGEFEGKMEIRIWGEFAKLSQKKYQKGKWKKKT